MIFFEEQFGRSVICTNVGSGEWTITCCDRKGVTWFRQVRSEGDLVSMGVDEPDELETLARSLLDAAKEMRRVYGTEVVDEAPRHESMAPMAENLDRAVGLLRRADAMFDLAGREDYDDELAHDVWKLVREPKFDGWGQKR